jgi:hypothetical protein
MFIPEAPCPSHNGHRAEPFSTLAAYCCLTFVLLFATYTLLTTIQPGNGVDLVQDYAAARVWLDGDDPYMPLNDLRARMGLGPVHESVKVGHNPHPPGAILATVPVAWIDDFMVALRVLELLQLAFLAVAWTWVRTFVSHPPPGWKWAAAGGLFGLWAPLWQGASWGQPDGMLALAVVALWWAARTDRVLLFGLILGMACSVRPFFGIAAVVAIGWPVARMMTAGVVATVAAAAPFALCRVWPWEWYRVASEASGYVQDCGSLPGVLGLSTEVGVVLYVLAAAGLIAARLRGLPVDSTLAVGLTLALITYPLAWFHYDVALIPVAAWVIFRVSVSSDRIGRLAVASYLALRSIPDLDPNRPVATWVHFVDDNQNVLQVFARFVLLFAVIWMSRKNWARYASASSAAAPRI